VQQIVDGPVGVAAPTGLTSLAVHGPEDGVMTTFMSATAFVGLQVTGESNESTLPEHVPFVVEYWLRSAVHVRFIG
jgi:hypothetical protein